MIKRIFLLVGILVLFIGSASVVRSAEMLEKFKVKGDGKLWLRIPDTCKFSTEKDGGIVHVEISPKEGNDFNLMISYFKPPTDVTGLLLSEEFIKGNTISGGKRLLPDSVEKELRVFRIDGTKGFGFFYFLTDAKEELPPDENRYLCQGEMVVDKILLTVTLFTHRPEKELLDMTFHILKTAKYD